MNLRFAISKDERFLAVDWSPDSKAFIYVRQAWNYQTPAILETRNLESGEIRTLLTDASNPRVARQMEAAYRTALAKGEVGIVERKPAPSFGEAMKDFLSWSERQHQTHPRTYRRYRVSSVALLRYFRDVCLDQIGMDDVERFKIQRAAQTSPRTKRTLKPATVNRELACLKALFNYAIRAELVRANPVSRVRFLAEQNEQTRVLTMDEQQQYLAVAPQPLHDVAVLMLETGMRPEEVYRIHIDNVNLEIGWVYNPYGKTKAARRKVPLSRTAIGVLRGRISSANGPYLFPFDGDPDRPMPKVNNAHDRAIAKLQKAGVARFRLYDLRHTWATRAVMCGIDLVTLAAMLGHARIQMVLRYAHPTEQHQAEAVRKLESFNLSMSTALGRATLQ